MNLLILGTALLQGKYAAHHLMSQEKSELWRGHAGPDNDSDIGLRHVLRNGRTARPAI